MMGVVFIFDIIVFVKMIMHYKGWIFTVPVVVIRIVHIVGMEKHVNQKLVVAFNYKSWIPDVLQHVH